MSWRPSEKKNGVQKKCLGRGSKAIWAMPIYTDHFSKRAFPYREIIFIASPCAQAQSSCTLENKHASETFDQKKHRLHNSRVYELRVQPSSSATPESSITRLSLDASVWWTSKQAAPVWGARLSLWCQGGDGSALTDRSGHEKVIAGLVFLSHLTAQLSSSTKVIYSQKLTTRWKNFKTIPGMTQPWERVRPFKQVFCTWWFQNNEPLISHSN